jgi:hypothetical protein
VEVSENSLMRTFARKSATRCLQAIILVSLLACWSLLGCQKQQRSEDAGSLRIEGVVTVQTDWGTHKITFIYRDRCPIQHCAGTFVTEKDGGLRFDGKKSQMSLRKEELVVDGTSYGVLKAGDSVTVDDGRILVNSRHVGKIADL